MSQLTKHSALEIVPTAPFSFEGTFHKPSHYPTPDTCYEHGVFWQTIRLKDTCCGIQVGNKGTESRPKLQVAIYHDPNETVELNCGDVIREIEYRYDLRARLEEFNAAGIRDEVLGPAIRRRCGMRVSTPYSLYEFLVITTLLQNTVVRRSVQMMANLFERFGKRIQFAGKDLFCFWSPSTVHAVDETELRSLKLGYRAKILKRQAMAFFDNLLDEQELRGLAKDPLREKLLELYGVGPATVQYILFEVFHHYDAFEHLPPWEQKIFSRLLFGKELVSSSRILRDVNRRYGQWRMLAAHYIFEDGFWARREGKAGWLDGLVHL
jgi:3-methyladenine DNA glycosylase/8-oxoguanine DNA glycosylase